LPQAQARVNYRQSRFLGFAGTRPRVQHAGEFGLSVAKDHWGQGIGSALIDGLLELPSASHRSMTHRRHHVTD
jgi:RimJ/RimL family protein N-acetyltransferase